MNYSQSEDFTTFNQPEGTSVKTSYCFLHSPCTESRGDHTSIRGGILVFVKRPLHGVYQNCIISMMRRTVPDVKTSDTVVLLRTNFILS